MAHAIGLIWAPVGRYTHDWAQAIETRSLREKWVR